jgi:hypothetical protein
MAYETRYTCVFEYLDNAEYTSVQGPYASLEDFKNGFWVDGALAFTKGTRAEIWIPSARIYYIKKSSVDASEPFYGDSNDE